MTGGAPATDRTDDSDDTGDAAASRTLSEAASKELLAPHGVPFPPERIVTTSDEAAAVAAELGFPVALKVNGDGIAHKTERGLVRLGLGDPEAVRAAGTELLARTTADDGEVALLVAPMIRGTRELIAGLSRDPQFGMTVMIGVGGILAEAVADVAIRLVPIDAVDAADMLDSLATQPLLGRFRGEPAIDRDAVVALLLALSRVASEHPEVVAVDLNPLIVHEGRPVAVDALVEVTVASPEVAAP